MPLLNRLLRAGETKLVKRLGRIAEHIDTLEPDVQALTDAELRDKTDEFRKRYADGETLDELLPEAFAVVREAAVRTIGQRHFNFIGRFHHVVIGQDEAFLAHDHAGA